MGDDFGISKVLSITDSEVKELVKNVRERFGIEKTEDKQYLEEKHLTRDKKFTLIQARKLTRLWRQGWLVANNPK